MTDITQADEDELDRDAPHRLDVGVLCVLVNARHRRRLRLGVRVGVVVRGELRVNVGLHRDIHLGHILHAVAEPGLSRRRLRLARQRAASALASEVETLLPRVETYHQPADALSREVPLPC